MASLTLRLVKGSPLTYQEVDDNFTNLNNELGSVSGGSAVNSLINSNFDVWQRGTSFNLNGATTTYTADRWACEAGTSGVATVSRVAFAAGQTDVPREPEFFLRHNRTNAATAANSPVLQRIEDVRSHAGTTMTFSFWAKVGSGSKSFIPRTVQNFGSGGSASVTKTASSITVTTSWQRFEITITNDSISGKTVGAGSYLQVDLLENTGFSTFTLDFAQSQVESGSSATAFVGRSFAEELSLCQRYFEKTYNIEIKPGTVSEPGAQIGKPPHATGVFTFLNATFKVNKRAIPTIIWYSPASGDSGAVRDETQSINRSVTSTTKPGEYQYGYPTVSSAASSFALISAHITADAEL